MEAALLGLQDEEAPRHAAFRAKVERMRLRLDRVHGKHAKRASKVQATLKRFAELLEIL
jgi:hypothetical protein